MAATETVPEFGSVKYQEPASFIRRSTSRAIGISVLKAQNFRICNFNPDEIDFEKPQEGVHRYPPVQVQVLRNPDFIQRYINMEPNTWSNPPEESI
jgi:hypothetical protein